MELINVGKYGCWIDGVFHQKPKVTWSAADLAREFKNDENRLSALKMVSTLADRLFVQKQARFGAKNGIKNGELTDLLLVNHDFEINKTKEHKQLLEKYLRMVRPEGDGKLDEQMVLRAKSVPITDFVQFRNGTAKCLWHNEKTPSMKYNRKTNRAHCFGCGKDADVIDVFMCLNNVSFVKAVKSLS